MEDLGRGDRSTSIAYTRASIRPVPWARLIRQPHLDLTPDFAEVPPLVERPTFDPHQIQNRVKIAKHGCSRKFQVFSALFEFERNVLRNSSRVGQRAALLTFSGSMCYDPNTFDANRSPDCALFSGNHVCLPSNKLLCFPGHPVYYVPC